QAEPEAAEQVEVLADEPEQYHVETSNEPAAPSVATATTLVACPYCWEGNEPQAFECSSCSSTLTLSDLESMFANNRCDREKVQHAVTQMEAEWNLREFDQREMKALALGHFNLQNYDTGMNYLQEALRLDPNDVILAGQLNTLAIRLDEIRRKEEVHDSMPKGKTILVVDDSATVRKLISGKLEKAGHAVVCAVDGVDGLARIDEQVPDLVLLDITMPRMDGYEVCKQIRANAAAKHVPIVMISGKDGFFDKVRGRMAGTTGYITKPFGPETLMKALETYLVTENGTGE
ncbi:MAG TPA: response regulator, partial [Pyrinomonadaceae bacterium]|nr:response regulator [Pyrinomonadaceae bacterium]